jgi:hypothetical protein
MHPLLLVATDGLPSWATALLAITKDVGIPVAGAAAIIYWFATRLERLLNEILAALRDNTKATVDFTASQREHTASILALKGQVAEVERDVEGLAGTLRAEVTGPHRVPPELRMAGGKKEGT